MILDIVLIVSLLAAVIYIIMLKIQGNKQLKPLEKTIVLFSEGNLQDLPDLSELEAGGKNLVVDLQKGLGELFLIFSQIEENSKKSERASTRLSRNIQKALTYSSGISSHAMENMQTSSRLFNLVAEGSAAVEEIHASIHSLKEHVMVQNKEIHHTSSAIQNISDALESISKMSSHRLDDTEHLVTVTAVGNRKISETDQVITLVQDQVGDVLKLISVINNIAAQTNLLSMNAAIEAAHAGDAGRGFAVVAEEIRNLAESTSNNAKSISETLKSLVSQIESAAQLSKESGSAFNQIEEGVKKVSQTFKEINQQTSAVSTNAQEVVQATSALQDISQNTTISMNEMETGAGEINNILENSNNISKELEVSMKDLTSKTQSINLITTKISSSFLIANRSVADILTSFRGYTRKANNSDVHLQDRIDSSNLILAHIHWVATARALMDGSISSDEVNLADSSHCDLGKWLNQAGVKKELGENKYSVLFSVHEELHQQVEQIKELILSNKKEEANKVYADLTGTSERIVEILTTVGYNDFVQWSEDLSIQVDEFDKHHIHLITLINKLYMAMESGEGEALLTGIFKDLIEYAVFHFAEEEKVMVHYNYDDLEAHRNYHRQLLKKAGELFNDFQKGKAVLSNEVLDFLQDWVLNHILQVDSNYSSFFQDKDLRALVSEYNKT